MNDLSLTMMVDNSQLLSIFIAAATTLIYLVVTRRRREADAARGADVVVVLCGDKPRARELLFAIPAVTLYECATFGDQLRLTTSFSARRDASFSSVIVIEPYVNFEGLDTMMAQPMITNFHRSMFRAAAGAVPVLGVVAEMPLLRLEPPRCFSIIPPLFKPNGASPVPAEAQAVLDVVCPPVQRQLDDPK